MANIPKSPGAPDYGKEQRNEGDIEEKQIGRINNRITAVKNACNILSYLTDNSIQIDGDLQEIVAIPEDTHKKEALLRAETLLSFLHQYLEVKLKELFNSFISIDPRRTCNAHLEDRYFSGAPGKPPRPEDYAVYVNIAAKNLSNILPIIILTREGKAIIRKILSRYDRHLFLRDNYNISFSDLCSNDQFCSFFGIDEKGLVKSIFEENPRLLMRAVAEGIFSDLFIHQMENSKAFFERFWKDPLSKPVMAREIVRQYEKELRRERAKKKGGKKGKVSRKAFFERKKNELLAQLGELDIKKDRRYAFMQELFISNPELFIKIAWRARRNTVVPMLKQCIPALEEETEAYLKNVSEEETVVIRKFNRKGDISEMGLGSLAIAAAACVASGRPTLLTGADTQPVTGSRRKVIQDARPSQVKKEFRTSGLKEFKKLLALLVEKKEGTEKYVVSMDNLVADVVPYEINAADLKKSLELLEEDDRTILSNMYSEDKVNKKSNKRNEGKFQREKTAVFEVVLKMMVQHGNKEMFDQLLAQLAPDRQLEDISADCRELYGETVAGKKLELCETAPINEIIERENIEFYMILSAWSADHESVHDSLAAFLERSLDDIHHASTKILWLSQGRQMLEELRSIDNVYQKCISGSSKLQDDDIQAAMHSYTRLAGIWNKYANPAQTGFERPIHVSGYLYRQILGKLVYIYTSHTGTSTSEIFVTEAMARGFAHSCQVNTWERKFGELTQSNPGRLQKLQTFRQRLKNWYALDTSTSTGHGDERYEPLVFLARDLVQSGFIAMSRSEDGDYCLAECPVSNRAGALHLEQGKGRNLLAYLQTILETDFPSAVTPGLIPNIELLYNMERRGNLKIEAQNNREVIQIVEWLRQYSPESLQLLVNAGHIDTDGQTFRIQEGKIEAMLETIKELEIFANDEQSSENKREMRHFQYLTLKLKQYGLLVPQLWGESDICLWRKRLAWVLNTHGEQARRMIADLGGVAVVNGTDLPEAFEAACKYRRTTLIAADDSRRHFKKQYKSMMLKTIGNIVPKMGADSARGQVIENLQNIHDEFLFLAQIHNFPAPKTSVVFDRWDRTPGQLLKKIDVGYAFELWRRMDNLMRRIYEKTEQIKHYKTGIAAGNTWRVLGGDLVDIRKHIPGMEKSRQDDIRKTLKFLKTLREKRKKLSSQDSGEPFAAAEWFMEYLRKEDLMSDML